MTYLIIRTVGTIVLTVIVKAMWIRHKKKRTLFIKRKPSSENQREKYAKWEKRLDVISFIAVLIVWVILAIPCCLDVPSLITGNLKEVSGVVVGGSMAGENSNSTRRIYVKDDISQEEISFKIYDSGVDVGERIDARYLPHTEFGYIVGRD